MTEVIIREMSQVTISDDLLKQVDMKELIEEFKSNNEKLDNFQKTREEYEKRGVGKKIWDAISLDKTMENAQLSATEVQAKFSKSLGQLMVISVAQSQYLQHQQEELAIQQEIIKNQTERIELQTHEIEKQHEVLAQQSSDLNKYAKDNFEIRGLTQEGAKKLISIANDIQHTRNDLLESMEKFRNWIAEQQEKTLVEISSQILVLEEYAKQNVDDIINRCQTVESENDILTQKLSDINIMFSEKYEEISVSLDTEQNKLNKTENNFNNIK